MQQRSLQDKIEQAREILSQALDTTIAADTVAVAWTGGKDSGVVLHLWRDLAQRRGLVSPLVALNLDTGVKFPEVLAFRDLVAANWSLRLLVARPACTPETVPVAQDKARCCAARKIEPLAAAIRTYGIRVLFTGVRRDEHPSRSGRAYREAFADPEHIRVHPILDFTEMDVWAYIMEHGLEYCPLYTQGYRSLGCMPCTAPPDADAPAQERSGRDKDKERMLEQLHSLGYF